MKKIIVALMLMVCANGWAGLYGKIEIGMPVGDSTYELNDYETEDYSDTYFTDLSLGYRNYIWHTDIEWNVYGGIFTWSTPKGLRGKPFEDIYGIGGRLKYNGFYGQVNHFCAHPVINQWNDNPQSLKYNQYVADNKSFYTIFSSVSVGYEFEIK